MNDYIPEAVFEAFPEHEDTIRRLLKQDPDFKRRADEFHELSRAVHRSQMHEEPTAEIGDDELRKRHDLAKDELYRLIML